MNPYETHPEAIPAVDPYLAQSIHYGRYMPRGDDFVPPHDRWCDSESKAEGHPDTVYWKSVVNRFCVPENSLNISSDKVDIFAVGSVLIRIDRDAAQESRALFNANELHAAKKGADVLNDIGVAVPVMYFTGLIDGRNVVVESRIAGVSLEVAWRYLSAEQATGFKQQSRQILQRLATGIGSSEDGGPSFICRELNAQPPINDDQALEKELLFGGKGVGDDDAENLLFAHNNMTRSNIIVNNDQIVGLLGWRQSGYFGFGKAGEVHRQLRVPESSTVVDASADERLPSWVDLYDGLSSSANGIPSTENNDGENPTTTAAAPRAPSVKEEPAGISLDKLPVDDSTDTPESKKITDLKQEVKSRASSSERSSPAASTTKTPAGGNKGRGRKRGRAPKQKAAPKKRKSAALDGDSVDGSTSNTPASSRASKTPAPKKQKTSASSSKKNSKKNAKKAKNVAVDEDEGEGEGEVEGDDDDEVSDDPNAVFCICRKPDNHTWMIGCDGECEDWFHGKCVDMDPRDADLIDRYICKLERSRHVSLLVGWDCR